MKKSSQHTRLWQIFLTVILFMAFVELAQVFRIRALYINPDQRRLVMHTLSRIADEQGWRLSDLSLARIDHRQMQFFHKTHHRGYDFAVCYYARYSASSPPIPCHEY